MVKKHSGFSLLEILIAVVIVILLAALVIPQIIQRVHKSLEAEAINNLGAIRTRELFLQNFTGRFAVAADEIAMQAAIGIAVSGNFFQYKIIEEGDDNFLAIATPTGPFSNWLEEKAIDKDGWRESGSYSGNGSGSSSGGGSSGGGSSGGGSSGGGSSGGGSSGGSTGGTGTGTTGSDISNTTINAGGTLTVRAPQNPLVIMNTGWADFSFSPYADVAGYIMQRGEQINGQVLAWEYVGGTSSSTPVDFPGCVQNDIVNGHTYCYQAITVLINNGTTYNSPPSSMVCAEAQPNPTFDALVASSKVSLNGVGAYPFQFPAQGITGGNDEVTFLNAQVTPVLYGGTAGSYGSYAYYNLSQDIIVVDDQFSGAPAGMTSALLAHEVLHNMWADDWNAYVARVEGPPPDPNAAPPNYGLPPNTWVPPDGWTGPRSANDSLFQEYSCFVSEAQAWLNLRAGIDRNSLTSSLKSRYDEFDSDMNTFLTFNTGGVLTGVKPFDDTMIQYLQQRGYPTLPEY